MDAILIIGMLLASHLGVYALGRSKGYEEGEDSMADVADQLRKQLQMYQNKEGF